MSTPAIRGIIAPIADCRAYFWRCLCLVLLQITRTVPLRRTILQFSQMRLTLVLTFIVYRLTGKVVRKTKDEYCSTISLYPQARAAGASPTLHGPPNQDAVG